MANSNETETGEQVDFVEFELVLHCNYNVMSSLMLRLLIAVWIFQRWLFSLSRNGTCKTRRHYFSHPVSVCLVSCPLNGTFKGTRNLWIFLWFFTRYIREEKCRIVKSKTQRYLMEWGIFLLVSLFCFMADVKSLIYQQPNVVKETSWNLKYYFISFRKTFRDYEKNNFFILCEFPKRMEIKK